MGSPAGQNMLVLAGPGSGKTTVVVHRCAYLLQVERVPARQILVLCFNHSAAVSLRKRLNTLVGREARGVLVSTYHGAAMRIAGISMRDMVEAGRGSDIDFDRVIMDAVKLLKGEAEVPGLEPDEVRDQLLGGYSHILVDEYQDIDQAQYDLVSAIAGRSLEDGEGRLSIMAVGDDDQNIYAFRGANVEFIQKFQEDYPAQIVHLVENYRSTRHVIDASNRLIRNNMDRMKTGHPIRIDHARGSNLPGGRWEMLDPVSKGRVQVIPVRDPCHQAECVKGELERLKGLLPSLAWDDCAIISRTKRTLWSVRALLEEAGIPVKTLLESNLPLHRVREISAFKDALLEVEGKNRRASELLPLIDALSAGNTASPWWSMIENFIKALEEETINAKLPVRWAIDSFYDYLAEQRREKFLGSGLFLGTIHSTKGMEFPHVFILDGDWSEPVANRHKEEERRTLYVGMTRARETLVLMSSEQRPNFLLRELKGGNLLQRKRPAALAKQGEAASRQYEILGLNDIFLSYAAGFSQNHPTHEHLSHVQTGERVVLAADNPTIKICDHDGFCIGRLSHAASAKWAEKLGLVREVRVVAMIERDHMDQQEGYRDRIKAEKWEVPVLEVVFG